MRKLYNDYENDVLMEMAMQVAYNNKVIEDAAGGNEVLADDDKEISVYMANQYLFEVDNTENSKLQDMRDYFNNNAASVAYNYFNNTLPDINFNRKESMSKPVEPDYRYITLRNETENQNEELNKFLEEGEYDYSESRDALEIYSKELYEDEATGIKDSMQRAMVRVPRLTEGVAINKISDCIANLESDIVYGVREYLDNFNE